MNVSKNIEAAVFQAALSLDDPAERTLFLGQACHGDPDLRRRIDELLSLGEEASGFFELPAAAPPLEMPRLAVLEGEEGSQGHDLMTAEAHVGHYRLLRRLGEGGCGIVYVAEQVEPVQRQVALKIIRLGMDTERVVARFELERQAMAMMDHPNIARVLDAGATPSGRPFFVMELVDGEAITNYCHSRKMSLRTRLEVFIQVCQGIQHAHQKGVIHRDIKPSNVLVVEIDGVAVPKVIDFGIAKAIGESMGDPAVTVPDQWLGTPVYMSPEQAMGGQDVDTRSDIYSLGALLYELLAGRPPFDPERFREIGNHEARRIVIEEEPPPPSVTDEGRKCADLAWIVMKAMAKARQDRYETVNGLIADIRRFLNDEPVLATPPSRGYAMRKFIRRNRYTVLAGAGTFFALMIGLGVSMRMYFLEKDAREEQHRLRQAADAARMNETAMREEVEFQSLISQAAVLMTYENLEGADKLLRQVPVDRTPSSLEAANTFRALADWHLFAGRWTEAARSYSSYAMATATVDSTDSDAVSRNLLPAAATVCHVGDIRGYEQIRELALKRFTNTHHPIVAEQLLKVALLKPADAAIVADLKPAAKVLEEAILQPGNPVSSSEHQAWWSSFALALMHYRGGEYERALVWTDRCLSSDKLSPIRMASVNVVLAMIDYQLGREQEARDLVARASGPITEKIALHPDPGSEEQGYWHTWVIANILLEEARASLTQPRTGSQFDTMIR